MKKIVIVSLVAILVVVSIFYLVNLTKPPKPKVTVENSSVKVLRGSSCWKGLINSECVDMISPADMIKQREIKPTIVSPEAKVKIEFKRKPIENTLNASLWTSDDEIRNVSIEENMLVAPKEKGVYIYAISASWERGNSGYIFTIEVQ